MIPASRTADVTEKMSRCKDCLLPIQPNEDIGQGQVITYSTPSHIGDSLYQIWEEILLNSVSAEQVQLSE